MPYSPLGRGFLTGQIKSPDDFEDGDFRRGLPRFQGENFDKNLELVEKVKDLAAARGVDRWPARAGVGARAGRRRRADPGDEAALVPGGERGRRRRVLDPEDLAELDAITPVVSGARYQDMAFVGGDTPQKESDQ